MTISRRGEMEGKEEMAMECEKREGGCKGRRWRGEEVVTTEKDLGLVYTLIFFPNILKLPEIICIDLVCL